MSLMINLFVGFLVGSSHGKVSIQLSYQIKSCSSVYCRSGILGILGIFFIIKCVGLKSIIFAINLNVASSSKVFITFDFVFLSIVLQT